MLSPTFTKLYFENAAGRLLEHTDGYVVFQYHAGKRKFAEFQALLTHTYNLLARNQWHRLLGDQRQMSPFTEEEIVWIRTSWLGKYSQRPGGLYGAIILAHDVYARLAMSQVMHESQASALTYRLFENEEDAGAWLRLH